MISIDWAHAGRVTVWVTIIATLAAWVGGILAVTTVRWDALAKQDEQDRHHVVGSDKEQIRTLARIDAAMAQMDALDAPDEHAIEQYVG